MEQLIEILDDFRKARNQWNLSIVRVLSLRHWILNHIDQPDSAVFQEMQADLKDAIEREKQKCNYMKFQITKIQNYD